jgi:hypothetical protein
MRVEQMNIGQLREEVLRLRFKRREQKKAFRTVQQCILEKNVQIAHLQAKLAMAQVSTLGAAAQTVSVEGIEAPEPVKVTA